METSSTSYPMSITQLNPPQGFRGEMNKNMIMLVTVVAASGYAMGFNPPGGVWQDSHMSNTFPGDPIIRSTHRRQYLVFFYCNATAFAFSLTGFFQALVISILRGEDNSGLIFVPPGPVMLITMMCFTGSYGVAAFSDKFSTIYFFLLSVAVGGYLAVQVILPLFLQAHPNRSEAVLGGHLSDSTQEHLREVLMLLATFAVNVTYVAGLSTPGGFWENTEDGHHAGEAILMDHQMVRLRLFYVCNTTAFAASLVVITVVLLDTKSEKKKTPFWCSVITLVGIVGAYIVGSSQQTVTMVYLVSLTVAFALYITLLIAVGGPLVQTLGGTGFGITIQGLYVLASDWLQLQRVSKTDVREPEEEEHFSRVQLFANLALTITYQAGLDPPGGIWQDNAGAHTAGDPILLTTRYWWYKAFFYCNSVSFLSSMLVIILINRRIHLKSHTLQAAMVLDLLGLIGAYATGCCRDARTFMYLMGIAGAAVLIPVVLTTLHQPMEQGSSFIIQRETANGNLGHDPEIPTTSSYSFSMRYALVDRIGKHMLDLAALAASMTYQTGLTPPGGFLQDDGQAGEPLLLHTNPGRYSSFFYGNTVSFMLSTALIIFIVNPRLYRRATRSHALSASTMLSFLGLTLAFVAGSTLHMRTMIYLITLVITVLFLVAISVLILVSGKKAKWLEEEPATQLFCPVHLMTLGILVAGVTYQAGLRPPGGAWQSSTGGHDAGHPVMHDSRRNRYLVFFYSNSTSFVASISVMVMLLFRPLLRDNTWWSKMMNATIVLDLIGLLAAYTAGSARLRNQTVQIVILLCLMLAYIVIYVALSKGRVVQTQGNHHEAAATIAAAAGSSQSLQLTYSNTRQLI